MSEGASGERGPEKEPGVGPALRTFSFRILIGTALATLAVVLALRWWSSGERARPPGAGPVDGAAGASSPPSQGPPLEAAPGTVAAAPAPPAAERAQERRRAHPVRRSRDEALPSSVPLTAPAREVERRRAAGALSEAQKRFERCPGGDVRRLAWIDPRSGVVKLVRERDDGVVLEEWFDDDGRLREALWSGRASAGSWGRRLAIDADGRETAQELAGGVVPDAAPPALDRRDPTAAFFAVPSCPR